LDRGVAVANDVVAALVGDGVAAAVVNLLSLLLQLVIL
jgi:hypothetical protein